MRFNVEPWAPEYAAPFDAAAPAGAPTDAPAAAVEESVELPVGEWRPLRPSPQTVVPGTVLFVDGVQRIDAFVWVTPAEGEARPGICASYAAGAIRCDGRAQIAGIQVQRGLFSPVAGEIRTNKATYPAQMAAGESVEQLRHAVHEQMSRLEARVAAVASSDAGGADLIVIDGPIRASQDVAGAMGYVKTHHVRYLSDAAHRVVAELAPGERTPLFVMATSWSRYSWYLRLPGPAGHAWAGIVRCEVPIGRSPAQASATADAAAATLPRFASTAHKDPRAPQNLYPIAGLERELRRRLGDPAYLYRELRVAAAKSA